MFGYLIGPLETNLFWTALSLALFLQYCLGLDDLAKLASIHRRAESNGKRRAWWKLKQRLRIDWNASRAQFAGNPSDQLQHAFCFTDGQQLRSGVFRGFRLVENPETPRGQRLALLENRVAVLRLALLDGFLCDTDKIRLLMPV